MIETKETEINDQWLIEKISKKQKLNEENIKTIKMYSKEIKKQITIIFEEQQKIAVEKDNEVIERAQKKGIIKEEGKKENYSAITTLAIIGILTDFNKVNNTIINSANHRYEDIVHTIKFRVDIELKEKTLSNEKITNTSQAYKKILQEEVTKLNQKGLTSFVAKNGAEWSPEAYIKLKTNGERRKLANQIQEERMKEIGGNYWEISQHTGARPKCYEDQGQIYSIDGDTTPIRDAGGNIIKVKKWENTSFGEPDGILGCNCRHSRYIFIPNSSIYREHKTEKSENDKEFLEQQKQRYYEREIRNKKRDINELQRINANEDFIKQKENSLKEFSKNYNNYLKETNRQRNYNHERILDESFISKKRLEKLKKQYDNYLMKRG